jgi:hypothetical protein
VRRSSVLIDNPIHQGQHHHGQVGTVEAQALADLQFRQIPQANVAQDEIDVRLPNALQASPQLTS